MSRLYQLWFYVPREHKEQVKQALFDAGAGKAGNYDQCCWETRGTGQFRPLEGSDPAIGAQGRLERLEEFKVEMVVEESLLGSVLEALRSAHPYEEPAYGAVKLETHPTDPERPGPNV